MSEPTTRAGRRLLFTFHGTEIEKIIETSIEGIEREAAAIAIAETGDLHQAVVELLEGLDADRDTSAHPATIARLHDLVYGEE